MKKLIIFFVIIFCNLYGFSQKHEITNSFSIGETSNNNIAFSNSISFGYIMFDIGFNRNSVHNSIGVIYKNSYLTIGTDKKIKFNEKTVPFIKIGIVSRITKYTFITSSCSYSKINDITLLIGFGFIINNNSYK